MRRLATIATGVALATPAAAGGLVLPERGAGAVSRAGAIVAGADDAEALWQDPAGLAHLAGDGAKSFVFAAVYLFEAGDVGLVNRQPGTLLPTVAAALGIGERLVIAGGITAPTLGVHSYDPASPSRYASIATTGSSFTLVTLGAAYAITDRLRVGATLQDLVSHVSSSVTLSLCTTRCGDATSDAVATLDVHDNVAPSGSLGVQYDATPALTLGLELQGPTRIAATGDLAIQVPASAKLSGSRARLAYALPPTLRAGAELRVDDLRVELALDVELWSLVDGVAITPLDIALDGAALGPLAIPRHDRTSFAPSLGAEYRIGDASLAAGVAYETAATPVGEVSALAIDAAKVVVGVGGGYASGGWRIGAAIGFAQLADVSVSPAAAQVPVLQPVGDPPSPTGANPGTYRSRSLLVGLRLGRVF